MEKFREYLRRHKNLERFLLPVCELGINRKERSDKRKKLGESIFIGHNRAKGEGLLWRGKLGDDSRDITAKDRNRIRRNVLKVHQDKLEQGDHKKLDSEELGAFGHYTNDSSYINKALHKEYLGRGDGEYREAINNLDSAISKGSIGKHRILYSGLGVKLHKNLTGMLRRGVIHNPSYTSTSHNITTASGFSRPDKDNNRHILEIHLPESHKGLYVEPITDMEGEHETILPRGMTFRVSRKPKVHIRNGLVHHVWRAEPIDRDEGERLHNKRLNDMIEGGDVSGIKDYYEHEASVSDRGKLDALVTTDPDKQMEYYRDKRNHTLLAGNDSLSGDIQRLLINSEKDGIQRHIATKIDDPVKHLEYYGKGYHEELSKNPHISPDLNERLVGIGGREILRNIHKKVKHGVASVKLLDGLIDKGDIELHRDIAKSNYLDKTTGREYLDHLGKLSDINDGNVHHNILSKVNAPVGVVKKIWDKDLGENRNNIMNDGNKLGYLMHMAVHGKEADKEYLSDKAGLLGVYLPNEVVNALSCSKNPKVISNFANNGNSYLPLLAKSNLDPIFTRDYDKMDQYVNDPGKHYLLKHNPNLGIDHHKKIMVGDRGHIKTVLNSHQLVPNMVSHIYNNYLGDLDEGGLDRLHDHIISNGTLSKPGEIQHVIDHGNSINSLKAQTILDRMG